MFPDAVSHTAGSVEAYHSWHCGQATCHWLTFFCLLAKSFTLSSSSCTLFLITCTRALQLPVSTSEAMKDGMSASRVSVSYVLCQFRLLLVIIGLRFCTRQVLFQSARSVRKTDGCNLKPLGRSKA